METNLTSQSARGKVVKFGKNKSRHTENYVANVTTIIIEYN